MKELSRTELKQIYGGQIPPDDGGATLTLMGWSYDQGICYCDWHIEYSSGGYTDKCHVECATTYCCGS